MYVARTWPVGAEEYGFVKNLSDTLDRYERFGFIFLQPEAAEFLILFQIKFDIPAYSLAICLCNSMYAVAPELPIRFTTLFGNALYFLLAIIACLVQCIGNQESSLVFGNERVFDLFLFVPAMARQCKALQGVLHLRFGEQ